MQDLSDLVTVAMDLKFAASGGFGNIWQGQLDTDAGSSLACAFFRRDRGAALISDVVLQVAVKYLRPKGTTPADLRRMDLRLRREITVWGRLCHPNVVPLLGTVSGPTGMISPWMEKGNLNMFLEEKNPVYTARSKLVGVASNRVWIGLTLVPHSPVTLPRDWNTVSILPIRLSFFLLIRF